MYDWCIIAHYSIQYMANINFSNTSLKASPFACLLGECFILNEEKVMQS